ncbi:hypothetical protein [Aestuariivirga sp.]|uniref:hypothetical protein n=1 Tax=Aestuariivirga sp. TaxID=2650926 RepID=UPI0039E59100
MIRNTIIILGVLATAATAIAAHSAPPAAKTGNVTVIYKNASASFPEVNVWQPCAVEDCSDVQS